MFFLSRAKRMPFALIGLAALLSALLISCSQAAQTVGGTDERPFVAVVQTSEQPAFNAVRDGLKDELAEAGYREGETLRWEWRSARINPVTAAQIARKYAAARPTVIVAIAPASAQAIAAAVKKTPVIFSAVSDPVGSALVENTVKPGQNISGVSDFSPIGPHLALIKEVLPAAKTIGVIYDAGAKSSTRLIESITAQAAEQGFTEVKGVTVFASDEVSEAASSLVGSVDALYVPPDETIMAALEAVVEVGVNSGVPVFAGSAEAVARGAIAGFSFSYYDIGRQTGAMVVKVIRGSRPGELPVEHAENLQLHINPTMAAALGVTFPAAVTARANTVEPI